MKPHYFVVFDQDDNKWHVEDQLGFRQTVFGFRHEEAAMHFAEKLEKHEGKDGKDNR